MMGKKEFRYCLAVLIPAMAILMAPPASGEVIDLTADSESYHAGDMIRFHGNTEFGDSGLVTIVIRDNEDNFVLLTQTITDENYDFEKTVEVNEKFMSGSTYDATGFISNMTAGATTIFTVSPIISPILPEPTETIQELPDKVPEDTQQTVPENDNADLQYVETPTKKPGFVDPSKDPQYYLNRYYNEPMYKSWFDKNYPELTIEEAVGYEGKQIEPAPTKQIVEKEIVPEAEALSIVEPTKEESNNPQTGSTILAVGGLGILFAAVYGVKRKIDGSPRHITINKEAIRKKITTPLLRSSPLDILQTRLARGEISLEEYEALERKLRG